MTVPTILAPLLVQVALTFALLFWTGRCRFAAVRSGEARLREIALGEPAWPPRATQAANAFANQFQLPVLFYVLVGLALLTRKADLLFVVLSWVFVLTRFVHAAIHVTSNRVPLRFQAFLAGAVILIVLWAVFAVRILA